MSSSYGSWDFDYRRFSHQFSFLPLAGTWQESEERLLVVKVKQKQTQNVQQQTVRVVVIQLKLFNLNL